MSTRPPTPPADEDSTREDSPQSGIDAILDHWLEFVTVLLLATASLAAAWGGYQSARWGGVQSTLYSKAGAVRVESTRAQTWGQLLAIVDLNILNQCADAYPPQGDMVLASSSERSRSEARAAQESCYEEQFGQELRSAMETWPDLRPVQDPDAPSAPSQQVNNLVRRKSIESNQLETEAGQLFVEGQAANQQSDDYVLTTVFLATVMFFGGLSSQLKWRPIRFGFLGFALTLLVLSLWRLATFPVM